MIPATPGLRPSSGPDTSRIGRRIYLNSVLDFVGHRYSDRFGSSYRERLVNFGLGILLQTGS